MSSLTKICNQGLVHIRIHVLWKRTCFDTSPLYFGQKRKGGNMELRQRCVQCLRNKEKRRALNIEDSTRREEYLFKVDEVIERKECSSPPEYIEAFEQIYVKKYGKIESYQDLKTKYNQFMLEQENNISKIIRSSSDPLKTALQAAQAGNYIDFIAMKNISEEKLKELLLTFETKQFHDEVYESFKYDLAKAKKVVYVLDNCGEIVIDKLVIQLLKEYYPKIQVTAIVRGSEIGNDVTMRDAQEVGLKDVARVLGNGTKIAGTSLHRMPCRARKTIEKADVVISKGQANYETLEGTGINVYYLFLCKCDFFMEHFQSEYLDPIFCKEIG